MARLPIALLCLAVLAGQAVAAAIETKTKCPDSVRGLRRLDGDQNTIGAYFEGDQAACNNIGAGTDYGCTVLEKLGSGWELATPPTDYVAKQTSGGSSSDSWVCRVKSLCATHARVTLK
ncbi:hypothetical protein IE81DRAFT_332652 [Ceraceosorus guamensis]|uniref:Uncharacterized protein n=1 Tax=Ceraceosorus guamensis TaxID=1522189 RepID=A0A316VNU4_9BASI|nr:hypothetical protein IE81DRAFT_332652 [Ceraceosorus guamensis]PWN38984.1 hypothetical protein IE81DRAFT_332652 [Ceraceosorus guamensis]